MKETIDICFNHILSLFQVKFWKRCLRNTIHLHTISILLVLPFDHPQVHPLNHLHLRELHCLHRIVNPAAAPSRPTTPNSSRCLVSRQDLRHILHRWHNIRITNMANTKSLLCMRVFVTKWRTVWQSLLVYHQIRSLEIPGYVTVTIFVSGLYL